MPLTKAITSYGTAIGAALSDCTVFRGIPYAKAARFFPPERPDPWQGERVFDAFSPIFPQNQPEPGMPFSDFFIKEFYPEHKLMSEDAHCLNIWTPAKHADEMLPVMVWFHGGGMGSGYGHELEFDGEAIAKRGVLLVTINYRLGCFGYFSHPELAKRIPGGVGGNNAIKDQQAALRWVQENIAAFGGDPKNVTIFGQSAGGGSVCSHLVSPLSRGLFARGIIQSGFGGISNYATKTLADTDTWGEKACEYLGKTLDELLSMPTLELHEAFNRVERTLGQIPRQVQDGVVFPEAPGIQIKQGIPGDMPIMIGSVSGDGGLRGEGREAVLAELRHRYGDRTEEFLAKFDPDDPKSAGVYKAVARSVHWADTLAFCVRYNSKNPVWLYYFDPVLPGHNESNFVPDGVAFHSAELWYMFGTLDRCWRPFDEKHHRLSDLMIDYWTNFAKNGDPNGLASDGTQLPSWPRYTQQTYTTQVFTEAGAENQQFMDDDVWPLIAFDVFAG